MASRPPPEFVSQFRNFIRDFHDFDIVLTKHARERMEERAVRLPDLQRVLQRGRLLRVEPNIRTGRDLYRVVGHDVDNRRLEVVVDLDATGAGCVVVVTVIEPGNSSGGSGSGRSRHGGRRPPNSKRKR